MQAQFLGREQFRRAVHRRCMATITHSEIPPWDPTLGGCSERQRLMLAWADAVRDYKRAVDVLARDAGSTTNAYDALKE